MNNVLQFAIQCALESGRIQSEYFQKRIGIHYKGEIDIVTDVDIACQKKIIELIENSYPDDYVIAEEKSNVFDEKRNKWIVDPLDGTTNYAHGYPFFCTSIAYEIMGEVKVGVVYNPIFNELFFSKR